VTDRLTLAEQFVNTTNSHIFLTGKAGTGKTTFLRHIAATTHKNFVIVAPTGIAALNAEGVTIHSQFLFPFGTYLPEPTNFSEDPSSNFFSRNQLARKHPLNSERKKVLRSLDLLIIDEVSMLRADILDAIDYRLRAAKNNFFTPFGGVQLLLIGDLYQLPPIVKDTEWQVLSSFYNSIHFFESKALQQAGYTYLELDKVYRQSDARFIALLNNLRNDTCTEEDLAALNAHAGKPANDKVITLTTHNRQADRLNQEALDILEEKLVRYHAEVKGDFPEHLFPLQEELALKVGARVMFTRNDMEGNRYYNGKIATVRELHKDEIYVEFDDKPGLLEVPKHEWSNKKYSINERTKEIEEEIIGNFFHYPLKLAWAITVHKSQGLTFDAANLLVDRAFAPGQVYVALSRLRSLEGLYLSQPIARSAIMSDAIVGRMVNTHQGTNLSERLSQEQQHYMRHVYVEAFSLDLLSNQLKYFVEKHGPKAQFEDEKLQRVVEQVYEALLPEEQHVATFMRQLDAALQHDKQQFNTRLEKGRAYYLNKLWEQLRAILLFKARLETLSKTKALVTGLEELDQAFMLNLRRLEALPRKLKQLEKGEVVQEDKEQVQGVGQKRAKLQEQVVQEMEENPLSISTKTGKKTKAKPKGQTYEETYALIESGKSLEEIAEERKLALSTIESHAARGVGEGRLKLSAFLSDATLEELEAAFAEKGKEGLAAVYAHIDRKYSFGQLRIFQAGRKR
jgi:ATP-dependent exoDNAse (exonuclease V) alpha subunit